MAGNLRNVRCGNQLYISLFGIAYDGFGYGVRTVSLCRGGKLYQLLFRNSRLCLAGLYIEGAEIPLCILSSFALLICANDVLLDSSGENILSITDGLLLLCFFTIFLSYTFAIAKRDGSMKEPEKEYLQEEDEIRLLPAWKSALYILGGLAGLIIGGNFFVDGASGIARGLGVSESIIGLTLVAGGTSLPELATSIVAALKKNPEIAIGNVIGSNLFNIFFVLGCSASITPLRLTGITNFDLWVLVGSSILLWLFGIFFGKRIITRVEGSILILCYIAYTAVLIYNL